MTKNKVAILLSAYNGERYLRKQIESIQAQTANNWELFIRDDGSTDRTPEIIRSFAEENLQIHFVNENNRRNFGVKKSFLTLLSSVSADFYMFSDQDDYWLPTKVSDTLAVMERDSQLIPQLVFTDLKLVDANLDVISETTLGNVDVNYWIRANNLFIDNVVTGCTVMINEALKQRGGAIDASNIVMHDWWFALLASQVGEVKYLDQATILYRQHGDNQVGIDSNLLKKIAKMSHFDQFQKQVNLQLAQAKASIQISQYEPDLAITDFIHIPEVQNFVAKRLLILKHSYHKHTLAGTLALNLALMHARSI